MITAEEAKKLAHNLSIDWEQLDRIEEKIKKEASNGILECYWYEHMKPETVLELRNFGYTVRILPDDPREGGNESTYKIEWKYITI